MANPTNKSIISSLARNGWYQPQEWQIRCTVGFTATLHTLSSYSSSGVDSSCFAEATLECSGCGKRAGMVVAARHLLQLLMWSPGWPFAGLCWLTWVAQKMAYQPIILVGHRSSWCCNPPGSHENDRWAGHMFKPRDQDLDTFATTILVDIEEKLHPSIWKESQLLQISLALLARFLNMLIIIDLFWFFSNYPHHPHLTEDRSNKWSKCQVLHPPPALWSSAPLDPLSSVAEVVAVVAAPLGPWPCRRCRRLAVAASAAVSRTGRTGPWSHRWACLGFHDGFLDGSIKFDPLKFTANNHFHSGIDIWGFPQEQKQQR